jgi:hypothetical protein
VPAGWGATWHLSLEKGMFRLASVFALLCLTVVAASFLDAQKTHAEAQPEDSDRDLDLRDRCVKLTAGRVIPFHAQFSLN